MNNADANIDISDYGIYSDAVSTTKAYNGKIDSAKVVVAEVKTTLGNESIFKGPIADNCKQELGTIDNNLNELTTNGTAIINFLAAANQSYQKEDGSAAINITNADGTTETTSTQGTLMANTNVKSSVGIPDSVKQAGYTVTCYGEGGWYLGGGDKATSVASGSRQEKVHNAWLANGGRYKNGIAVMNVNGQDRYLIATAPTFGRVGDSIDVKLDNGQTVPCVIADAKSTSDSNYTTYGHGRVDGSVNVLEFEVDRHVYRAKGNPTSSKWGLEWDSSSDVNHVDNYGTII